MIIVIIIIIMIITIIWHGPWDVRLDATGELTTPSPPTKSFDFGGFDSSKLLILRGGNSHVHVIL